MDPSASSVHAHPAEAILPAASQWSEATGDPARSPRMRRSHAAPAVVGAEDRPRRLSAGRPPAARRARARLPPIWTSASSAATRPPPGPSACAGKPGCGG